MADFFGDADFEDVEGGDPEGHVSRAPAPLAALNDLEHVTTLSAGHAVPLYNAGYREGAGDVVESALQEGFDIGFEEGIKDGTEAGRLLGALSAMLVFSGAAEQQGEGQQVLLKALQERVRNAAAEGRAPEAEVVEQVRSHVGRCLGEHAVAALFPPRPVEEAKEPPPPVDTSSAGQAGAQVAAGTTVQTER